jgi:hypothetical protein
MGVVAYAFDFNVCSFHPYVCTVVVIFLLELERMFFVLQISPLFIW